MPWAEPSSHGLVPTGWSLLAPETRPTFGGTLVGLWVYPASVLVSAAIVAACAHVVDRRGGRHVALSLVGLWVTVNILELIGKLAIERPPVGLSGLRHSYPSGHTLRACVVATAVALVWRRAAPPVAMWAAGVPIALVALGEHTPTDVVGGLLLAGCLLALWRGRVVPLDESFHGGGCSGA